MFFGPYALTEPASVYRPRHPERTVVYRLFEEHFERYVREYEERYEAREGSLRKVVPTAVEASIRIRVPGWEPSAAWNRSRSVLIRFSIISPSDVIMQIWL